MFTSIDKALVAGVLAIMYLLNQFFGLNFGGITEEQVSNFIIAALPFAVWAVPNKKPVEEIPFTNTDY